jgi:hypothetical protein
MYLFVTVSTGPVSRGVTDTRRVFRASSKTGLTAPASSLTWTAKTYPPKSSGLVV